MATIIIRGKQLKSSPDYTDRDVLALAQLGTAGIPRAQREQEAADALATIFPDIPSEWIAGGRVRLHTYELLGTIATLKGELESNPAIAEAMALIATLPVSQDVINQARQAQAMLALDAEKTLGTPPEFVDEMGHSVSAVEACGIAPAQGFTPRSAEERKQEEIERQRAEAEKNLAKARRAAELRAELAKLEGEA